MRIRDRLRDSLDTWQFWVGVAYFGLVLVVGALWFVHGDQIKADALRRADQQTLAVASVLNCQQEARRRGQFTALLLPYGQLLVDHGLATPATTKAAIDLVNDTPTMDDCERLEARLGVTPTMLIPR